MQARIFFKHIDSEEKNLVLCATKSSREPIPQIGTLMNLLGRWFIATQPLIPAMPMINDNIMLYADRTDRWAMPEITSAQIKELEKDGWFVNKFSEKVYGEQHSFLYPNRVPQAE